MNERLPTELWVTAHLRQCGVRGVPVYVLHKGAYASGTVMVKIVMRGQGCRLLNQFSDIDGNLGWMDLYEGEVVGEERADHHIQQAIARDRDIWVIEVEDAGGKNPFEGKTV